MQLFAEKKTAEELQSAMVWHRPLIVKCKLVHHENEYAYFSTTKLLTI